AMPSPIEMMLPTSATSTSTAKLPICSRMILEISSALMSMRSSHALYESLLHLLQLRCDAAVINRAAQTRDDSADDRRIHARRQRDGSSSDRGEALLDRLRAIGGQRPGGHH